MWEGKEKMGIENNVLRKSDFGFLLSTPQGMFTTDDQLLRDRMSLGEVNQRLGRSWSMDDGYASCSCRQQSERPWRQDPHDF